MALPPLRERGDDVLEIAHSMLPEGITIDPPAEKALRAYPWPGNIRELSNVIEQATFNTEGTKIRLRDLPANVASEGRKGRVEIPLARLSDVEAKHILKVLRACDGNKTRTAEILGISRETLYQKLRLYRLNP